MIEIIDFEFDKRLLKKFIDYGYKIYENDNNFIPAFKDKIKFELSIRNSFFKNGRIRNFMSIKDERIVARVSAMIKEGCDDGIIGYFECEKDYDVVKRVFDVLRDFFKSYGCKTITGPINFTTWNRYRFVIKSYRDIPPFFMEPYNKSYYHDFFIKYGFKVLKTYYSNIVKDIDIEQSKIKSFSEKAIKNGYYIRYIDFNNLKKELEIIYNLTKEIFSNNFYYSDIDFNEFKMQYSNLDKIIKPEYFEFVCNKKGEECGFLFGYPDYRDAIKSMNGNNNILSKIKFLLNKKKRDTFIMKSFGVKKNLYFSGAASLLVYTMYENLKKDRFKNIIHALMIEDNTSRKYGMNTTDIIREYALYRLEDL
ncbi:MAG TPA: hypothetical protein PLE45_00760 [Spirochaetota bacterium]|nr:hypothetical protein [Spirochaetota bacterium]HOL56097.1 hypothetical protein [Spirochaetota bacterium]HPP03489.1 hypothetical protein [Spirochaetota bacterium]